MFERMERLWLHTGTASCFQHKRKFARKLASLHFLRFDRPRLWLNRNGTGTVRAWEEDILSGVRSQIRSNVRSTEPRHPVYAFCYQ